MRYGRHSSSTGRKWLVSPEEIEIPTLPDWFCDELLEGKDTSIPDEDHSGTESDQHGINLSATVLSLDGMGISRHDRFRVFHSPGFWQVWNQTVSFPRDNSDSAFEFSLSERTLAYGLTPGQVLGLIRCWRSQRGKAGKEGRYIRKILPDAIIAAAPSIRAFREREAAKKAAKLVRKTRTKILAFLGQHGPSTPAQIVEGIGSKSSPAVRMQLLRMTETYILSHVRPLYAVAALSPEDAEDVRIPRNVTFPIGRNVP